MNTLYLELPEKAASIKTNYKLFLTHFNKDPGNLNRFLSLNHDEKQFQWVFEQLPSLKLNLPEPVKKSDLKSDDGRYEGNNYYSKKDNLNAIQYYNKSLAYAPTDSAGIYYALSNRSASLLDMGAIHECENDINYLLSLPKLQLYQHIREKVLLRKSKCAVSKLKSQFCFGFAKTPTLPSFNSFFECASAKVGLRENTLLGRHLFASDDIKTGEILIVEDPYCVVPLIGSIVTHCDHCLNRSMNLLACPFCPCAMYCSNQCQKISWDLYHKEECIIKGVLLQLDVDKYEMLVLRTIISAVNEAGSLKNLKDKVESAPNALLYKASDFKNIFELIGNKKKRLPKDILRKTFVAAVIINVLKVHTSFFSKEPELLHFVGGLFLRLRFSFPCNAHQLSEYRPHIYESNEIGAAACATLSLLNHSCDPNVTRENYGKTIVLRALRPISKGSEILDNYGYHYALHTKTERQNSLQDQFYFTCQCQACLGNWPLYEDLPVSPNLNTSIETVIDQVHNASIHVDMVCESVFRISEDPVPTLFTIMDFLSVHVPRPAMVFNKCEELIKHCLFFAGNHFVSCDQMPVFLTKKA